MSQRANITLTDAATTPVNRVYYPAMSKEGALTFVDRTQAVSIGQNRLTLEQRVPTRQLRSHKVAWKLETPILEQTSPSTATGIQPAPTVAYSLIGKVEFVFPDRCTLQERKDILAQVRDLVDEAIVTSQVHDLDLIY